ncbi:bleomycin resistance protein [Sporosarcina sp. BI001-red]|uniref:VOC family protein n=1 Tax=Sporosarcina sp. BI001-red TaxID=2282866 RepID=UPI000E24518D|nr:bleomycin resistance protein [Sporosarcina sp. BI001-red]REB05220.1 bleomycin resistance protein [Sporosarcina sp. BI001-red]
MDSILGVEEVLFFVNNVQDAKQWFIELLGENPYFDDERYCAFYLANATVGLHPSDEKISSGVAGQVTYWRVSDIKKTIAHFESKGCRLFRGPTFGIDKAWICQLMDPFDNVWGLVEK